MLKTANAIRKLQKAGAEISAPTTTRFIARFPAANVEVSHNDGYVSSLYVIKHGAQDDVTTDRFTGTFKSTVNDAVELATRMASW